MFKEIQSKHNPDTLEIALGSRIQNKAGALGSFVGEEETDGATYLMVQYPDYLARIPKKLLGNKYHLITDSAEIAKAKSPEIIEFERKRKLLLSYIKANQNYTLDTFYLLKEQREKLTILLDEAKVNNFIFRGDARHPYAKGSLDIKEEIKEGPFRCGFIYDPDKAEYDGAVYTTANIERAMGYPDVFHMPKAWDGRSYLYFINPRKLLDNPTPINESDLANNEIVSKDFPSDDIRCAIEMNRKSIIEIIDNPNYLI